MASHLGQLVDFGPHVPVYVSPEAIAHLTTLPQPAMRQLLDALRKWAKGVPLRAARATMVADPEVDDWMEISIDLLVESDTEGGLILWDDMGAALDKVQATFTPADRSEINGKLGIHLLWGADEWDDKLSAV